MLFLKMEENSSIYNEPFLFQTLELKHVNSKQCLGAAGPNDKDAPSIGKSVGGCEGRQSHCQLVCECEYVIWGRMTDSYTSTIKFKFVLSLRVII